MNEPHHRRLLNTLPLLFLLQTTAFAQAPSLINYQGRLLNGTNLVNGTVGLELRLYAASSGGSPIFVDSNQVAVTDGLYATLLGDNPIAGSLETALAGSEVWIEVAVNGTTLSPREQLVSAAYAVHAWGLSGNKGTTAGTHFVGTLDDQPVEVRVDGSRAARFAPSNGAPNIVLGPAQNVVSNGGRGISILGGSNNTVGARSDHAVLSGGQGNRIGADSLYSSIAGGQDNAVSNAALHASIGGGNNNRIAFNAGQSAIGGGSANRIGVNSTAATIAGGTGNAIGADASNGAIGGGQDNAISNSSASATIAGGVNNRIAVQSSGAAIGGGGQNVIGSSNTAATIAGGFQNDIGAGAAFAAIAGGSQNRIQSGATNSFVGGGGQNGIQSNVVYSFLGGGYQNSLQMNANGAVLVGGSQNTIQTNAWDSFLGGGWNNTLERHANGSFLGGGSLNKVRADAGYSFLGGGYGNTIRQNTDYAFIGGGEINLIQSNADYAVISGGENNIIKDSATHAVILGGENNVVGDGASYAIAGGKSAIASHPGSLVWGDSSGPLLYSAASNSVTMRAAGGYRFFSNAATNLGAQLAPNATAWAALSDRNAKENFEPINTSAILDRVAQLPLAAWTYKNDPDHRRYIGPTAQDFHAAFGLGNDTTINTLDADGVALASIQALAKENAELRAANQTLQRQMSDLNARLSALESR